MGWQDITDNFIRVVNPERALRREAARITLGRLDRIKNSGYDQGGANTRKSSMKSWHPHSKSPQEDIDANLHTLRQRTRDLCMSSPLAVSAKNTKKTNVIGAGLKMKCRIDFRYLGMSREQAEIWERNTEREFELFASSRWSDSLRINNFYENQALMYTSWLMNGDAFALIEYDKPKQWMPYSARLRLIEADKISTPNTSVSLASGMARNTLGINQDTDYYIFNGVEIDKKGGIVAYWVCNQYPNSNYLGVKKEWTRVKAFGSRTGNPNILHFVDPERCEQYRGVPFLAPVIEPLKQVTRMTEAELEAAVVQSFFAAFIKTKGPASENPFGSVYAGIDDGQQEESVIDPSTYELGSGSINVLNTDEDIVFADPKRPASGFDGFVTILAKLIGSAVEIPHELLMKSFTASYSASRAALLEAWKSFKRDRVLFANDFCQQFYEIWLSEAISIGRISAPGFFSDPATKMAWTKTEWIGPAPGQLDPVKEVNAAIKRVENGFSTHEKETTEMNGGNWDDNIEKLVLENQRLKEANPLQVESQGKEGVK